MDNSETAGRIEGVNEDIFIRGLNKFSQLISTYRKLSKKIENLCESRKKKISAIESLAKERNQIIESLAEGGNCIYSEAIKLRLPTKPDAVLHLATNMVGCDNEAQEEDLINKAEYEILQLCLEARTLQSYSSDDKASGTAGDTEKRTSFWKWLYETTLKVLVDAVLERVWHKPK